MITSKEIIKHTENKQLSEVKNDSKLQDESNKKLSNLFEEQIKVIQTIIESDIEYKNKASICKGNLKKNKLNKQVKTVNDAKDTIYRTNLFELCGFNSKEKEKFEIQLPIQYKYIGFLAKSEEEAKNKLIEISEEYQIKNPYIKEDKQDNYLIYEVFIPVKTFGYIKYDLKMEKYYLYIAKDNDDNNFKYTTRFNFVDIYRMLFNIANEKKAVHEILDLLEVKSSDVQPLIERYINNIRVLENIKVYPYLNKLIKKQVYILKEILNLAIEEIYFCKEKENVYYVPFAQNYLAKRLQKSKSTIKDSLIAFALLGFYSKTSDEDEEEKTNKNKSTLYHIYEFNEEVLAEAEKIAKIFRENQMTLSYVPYEKVCEVFGKDRADKVIQDILTKRGKTDDNISR